MASGKYHKQGSADSLLVGPGKSRRLQEMRNKALGAEQTEPVALLHTESTEGEASVSPELAYVRQLIDKHLAEILGSLPAGRQKSLFKIRFGVELSEIKDLPISRVVALLKIRDSQLLNPRGNMKQAVELTYNGRQAQ